MARWKLTSSRSWPGATGPGPGTGALGPAQAVLLVALRAYKLVLSPLFAGACRHVPSCSTYAAEAVTVHGAVRGSWLAAKRLARCHPFGTSGFDPVPPAPVAQTPDRVPR